MVAEFLKGSSKFLTREKYYRARGINEDEVVCFQPQDVRRLIFQHKSYGPWYGPPALHLDALIPGSRPDNSPITRQPLPVRFTAEKADDPLGLREHRNARKA